jgi:hypothetical protein
LKETAGLLVSAALVGAGATLISDLWALVLKVAFRVAPSNYRLVGRWILHIPRGVFRHPSIGSTEPRKREHAVGWVAHYGIGVVLGTAFMALAGAGWLRQPAPLPAVIFGVVSVLLPFFVVQPSLGLGPAASRAANPTQARLRSLMNHTVFGIGLYVSGWLVSRLHLAGTA